MIIERYPERNVWPSLIARPMLDSTALDAKVLDIIGQVKADGDQALKRLTLQFDGVEIDNLKVHPEDIREATQRLDPHLLSAIQLAARNIRKFHEAQVNAEVPVETMPGVRCWRKGVPIGKVGLYIPGGTAPLFSTVLMLGIPAVIAGCPEIVLCTPPGKDGHIHPAVLAAAQEAGIKNIFKVGGVQAIAAMGLGTASIPKVFKICGPGNQYVTTAKQLIQQFGVAIDMPAGPSEVAVFADASANPHFIAADLLSQAEHGSDSQVLLVTCAEQIVDKVLDALQTQLSQLPRKNFAQQALDHSRLIIVRDREEAMGLLNDYAPEHLILACDNPEELADKVVNAGSVFLGNYSPESAGDYASGTNHTLPTNGHAHAYSGVSVDSFLKKITFQQITKQGLELLGPSVQLMAEAEGLTAHARAISVRLEKP